MNISIGVEKTLAQPWQQIYPDFRSNDVAMLVHWRGDTIFAVGDQSLLLRSTNSGLTWTEIYMSKPWFNFIRAEAGSDLIYILPEPTEYTREEWYKRDKLFLIALDPRTNDTWEMDVPFTSLPQTISDHYDLSVSGKQISLLKIFSRKASIVFSSNAGLTWENVSLPDSQFDGNLSTINFRNSGHGVIISSAQQLRNYVLSITTDNGTTWRIVNSIRYPDNQYLGAVLKLSVQWMNDSTLIAVHDGFQFSKTSDTGISWSIMGSVPFTIAAFHISESGIGYAVGTKMEVSKTSDGGNSWILLREKMNYTGYYPIHGISIDQNTFLFNGLAGNLFLTLDGGITWDAVHDNPFINNFNIHFFSANEGAIVASYLATKELHYLRTTTGGNIWESQSSLASFRILPQYIHDASPTLTYLLRSFSDTLIYVTRDKGRTWISSYTRSSGEGIEFNRTAEGIFSSGDRLCLVPTNKGLLQSLDQGISWKLFAPFDSTQIVCLDAKHAPHVWVMTRRNVWRSTDDGTTWMHALQLPDSLKDADNLFDQLRVLSDSSVYLKLRMKIEPSSGNSICVLTSSNTGISWRTYSMSFYIDIKHVFSTGREIGSYGYRKSTVLVSTEDEWNQFHTTSVIPNTVMDMFFVNDQIGWLTTYSGLFRTTNGGINWIEQPINSSSFSLSQNYPNPTSSLTTIPFEITPDVASRNFNHGISLVVYDLLGREVATIARDQLEVGKNQISFDASRLQAGVYCYRLMVGEQAMTRKMVVVR